MKSKLSKKEMLDRCEQAAKLIFEIQSNFDFTEDWQAGRCYRTRLAIGELESIICTSNDWIKSE